MTSEGSERGTTTRKLVYQEWKPLGGRRVERYVAMPGGQTIPGLKWVDDLAGGSEIINEVVGYAELPSRRKFPALEDDETFVTQIEKEAAFVEWIVEGLPESAEQAAEAEEVTYDEGGAADGEPPSEAAETVEQDESPATILTVDGEVEFSPEDEPYLLPPGADEDDVEDGVRYAGRVNSIETYGVFVELNNVANPGDCVSGLLHSSEMGLHNSVDFEVGEIVSVTLEDREGGLSFVLGDKDLQIDTLGDAQ